LWTTSQTQSLPSQINCFNNGDVHQETCSRKSGEHDLTMDASQAVITH
jgi:hypothetical protein